MSKKSGDRRPYMPPVTRIELSEKNIKLRWILLAVLLAIASVALFMGMRYALNTEPGWQEIQTVSDQLNCSEDFVFLYECGSTGLNATAEHKAVTALYTQLTESAYRIFSAEAEPDAENRNLSYLNAHVNEPVTVCPELYQALELIARYDNRHVFLAAATREYAPVFLAANDGEAAAYDPNYTEEKADYVREAAAYASDPESIRLELLEDGQVCLRVSDGYLAYARENAFTAFLDLGWMKNAFIADYLAEQLAQYGYTNGSLVSYDGFTRNLDTRGTEYAFNLFDRWGNNVSIPAELLYSESRSIVNLRNYPLSEEDRWHYYAYENGDVTSVYLAAEDGMAVSSTDNLVAYSRHRSCGELLMEMAPRFLTPELDREGLLTLAEQGVYTVWGEENVLCYTQKDAKLNLLTDSGGGEYSLQYVS